jgi:RHH-type transcriptional regulator, rel operon repressor / antitoxin RelB
MLSVRLPEDIEKRLDALASATGRSKSYYVRAAVMAKLEDMEDIYMAEAVMERLASGEEKVLTSEEFWRGLDD